MGKFRVLALGTAAALASLATMSAANATLSIVQIASPGNFGTFDNNPVGATYGNSVTNSGPISFQTTTGAVADPATSVPYTSTNAEPFGDTTNYLWDVRGATVAFTNGPVTAFDIYWGSIDGNVCPSSGCNNNNLLTLNVGGNSISGVNLVAMGLALGNGDQSDPADNKWYRISDTTPFSAFAISSSTYAFEFDMAAPEPSTWAMMVLGFAGLGYAAFRKAGRASISALA